MIVNIRRIRIDKQLLVHRHPNIQARQSAFEGTLLTALTASLFKAKDVDYRFACDGRCTLQTAVVAFASMAIFR